MAQAKGRVAGILLVLLATLSAMPVKCNAGASHGSMVHAGCDDVLSRRPYPHLNVLTVNLLYSETAGRDSRLERIADFAARRAVADGEPVDIIFLQEVVGGLLTGTANTGRDLRDALSEKGLEYHLGYRPAYGIPGIMAGGLAVLSRCAIARTRLHMLPFAVERGMHFSVPFPRGALLVVVQVPGWGAVDVWNSHLCAKCSAEDRLRQTAALAALIDSAGLPTGSPGTLGSSDSPDSPGLPGAAGAQRRPVILGIDLNMQPWLPAPTVTTPHSLLTDAGFADTFAVLNGCDIPGSPRCCPERDGCTVDVSDRNPFEGCPPTGGCFLLPRRIDFIFAKGFENDGSLSGGSRVVFRGETETQENPGTPLWVSNHCGVLTSIRLPEME